MACVGAYAEAHSFASFFCYGNTITGAHEGAGPADAALVYAAGGFLVEGVKANQGMVLYNLTAGTNGLVTAATATTITATGVTWNLADLFRITLITGIEISTIQHYLDIAASDIHAALAATGACDCTLAAWATGFLEKLNIIDAAAYYSCPCGQPKFSDAQKNNLLQWMSTQLEMLVTGDLDVCAGATGAKFPALGWADQAVSDFASAQIIWNDILRNSG